MKKQYIKHIADKLCISIEDLTKEELLIIESTYEMWEEKMEDIKLLKEEVKRLEIENKNLKSFNDNTDY